MVSNWKPGVTVSKYRGRGTPEWFWNRVDQSGGLDACWPWKLRKDKDGYGQVTWLKKKSRAHRIASVLAHGPIEDGSVVMHSCDNPPCCNPRHLVRGTNDDNIADRQQKGRQAKGEKLAGPRKPSPLSDAAIEEVREAYAAGFSQRKIAEEYGVPRDVIRAIVAPRRRSKQS